MAFEFTLNMFLKEACRWIGMLNLSSSFLIPATPISSRNPMTISQKVEVRESREQSIEVDNCLAINLDEVHRDQDWKRGSASFGTEGVEG